MSTRTLSDRINKGRNKLGLTIKELSDRSGVPRGTVWNWESGRCTPAANDPQLQKVAKVIDLPKVAVSKPVASVIG